jgi:4-amino-4-deoxy-L-arabinose transferase-like glycosyltransferase
MASLVLCGYIFVTFWNLAGFPPYFFCDESIAGIDARSILETGKDHRGRPWPILFHGLGEYALSLSVYLQIPFVALLGLDEVAVRARAAVLSVLGVLSLAAIFSFGHGVRRAWLLPIVLASSTFWYIHSRTGFEYMDATVCYFFGVAAFLRACQSGARRWYVMAGLVFGLCFYAYTPARGWVASLIGTLGLLAIIDRRLSWRGIAITCATCAVVLVPFMWLQYSHPEITMQRFQAIRGERIYTLPLAQVIQQTALNYASVLNPYYWFFRLENLHPRHSLPGFTLIPLWLFPLWIIGVFNLVWGWRALVNRVVILIILTTPVTAALFEISTARCLPVGVAYVLLCAFGADLILRRLPSPLALISGAAMCGYVGWLFMYTQTKALYSYPFYGMYGIQYGARQLYDFIRERARPGADIRVINATFNSGETHRQFYLSAEERARVAIIEPLHICQGREEWKDSTLFIFPALWFESVPPGTCPPFEREVVEVIRDPRGEPLYEFLRLKHSPVIEEWFANVKRERLKLRVDEVVVSGMKASFEHTKIAWGTIEGFFDGDSGTRSRTDDINPGIFALRFAPTRIDEVSIRLDNTSLALVTVEALRGGAWLPLGERDFSRARGDSTLVSFKNTQDVIEGVRCTVRLTDAGDRASVHLADIMLKKANVSAPN